MLQKSPRRGCRIEIRNDQIEANGFLNQRCISAHDLKSILRARMRKIVLQHNRHIAAPDVCGGTSAVGESRHRIPGASVGQPTEPCLDVRRVFEASEEAQGGPPRAGSPPPRWWEPLPRLCPAALKCQCWHAGFLVSPARPGDPGDGADGPRLPGAAVGEAGGIGTAA